MIYDMQSIKLKYDRIANLNQKISLDVKNNKLIRIKRGLFTDDLIHDSFIIANICYSPSYISFEYALYYYGLIPENVSVITSAVYGKKNNKAYQIGNYYYEYKSIPNEVFPLGINLLKNEKGMNYKMACKEKALCDQLYSKYPVRSIKELKIMLFDDLRIDENELLFLDFDFIKKIAPKYHSNTLKVFVKYLEKEVIQ